MRSNSWRQRRQTYSRLSKKPSAAPEDTHISDIDPRRLLVQGRACDRTCVELPQVVVRPHLYNPGICTSSFCQDELSDASDATCAALHEHNYYAKEAAELRQPIRLHAEELTAQTDDQPD